MLPIFDADGNVYIIIFLKCAERRNVERYATLSRQSQNLAVPAIPI